MRKNLVLAIVALLALSAGLAQAQQRPDDSESKVGSWVAGVDFVLMRWADVDWTNPAFGTVHTPTGDVALVTDQTKGNLMTLYLGRKPLDHGTGFEARFTRFGGGSGQMAGVNSLGAVVWGINFNPYIGSSSPVQKGALSYSSSSSMDFTRIELLANKGWHFNGRSGWISIFGGVPILHLEASEGISESENFLLLAKLPNGTTDPNADKEVYGPASTAQANYWGVGLEGGIEGEHCLFGGLYVDGRIALGVLPWGRAQNKAQFGMTKDIYLVKTADGVNGVPTSTLAHLNLNNVSYSDGGRSTVKTFDAKVGLKYRTPKLGPVYLDLGVGVSWLNIDAVPIAPAYAIKDPLAMGAGTFRNRQSDFSLKHSLTFTIAALF
jgi:hypothetical protein